MLPKTSGLTSYELQDGFGRGMHRQVKLNPTWITNAQRALVFWTGVDLNESGMILLLSAEFIDPITEGVIVDIVVLSKCPL